jgi:seryl-tRNA synthetase
VYYRFFYAFNMLTIPYIKENKDQVLKGLQIKNFNHPELIDQVLELDNERRALQSKTNELQALMNTLSKEIGQLFKSGDRTKPTS